MSEYWRKKISDKYCCGNCGGAVKSVVSAPLVKGHGTKYKCIRCTTTGTVRDQLHRDLHVSDNLCVR